MIIGIAIGILLLIVVVYLIVKKKKDNFMPARCPCHGSQPCPYWLRTQAGRDWLNTYEGKNWLAGNINY